MMKCISEFCSAILLVLITSLAFAVDFPTAPAKLKEMEAKGMPRLNAEELKSLLPGVMEYKGSTGRSTMIYKSDGSVDRKSIKDTTGKWRVDDKKNAYCLGFTSYKGYEEDCFAVFRAPDGTHYFDYDIDNGFYAHVWRRSEQQ